jgi:hypothetical protein
MLAEQIERLQITAAPRHSLETRREVIFMSGSLNLFWGARMIQSPDKLE